MSMKRFLVMVGLHAQTARLRGSREASSRQSQFVSRSPRLPPLPAEPRACLPCQNWRRCTPSLIFELSTICSYLFCWLLLCAWHCKRTRFDKLSFELEMSR